MSSPCGGFQQTKISRALKIAALRPARFLAPPVWLKEFWGCVSSSGSMEQMRRRLVLAPGCQTLVIKDGTPIYLIHPKKKENGCQSFFIFWQGSGRSLCHVRNGVQPTLRGRANDDTTQRSLLPRKMRGCVCSRFIGNTLKHDKKDSNCCPFIKYNYFAAKDTVILRLFPRCACRCTATPR